MEALALDLSDLELKSGRLARAIAGGQGSRAPGGATMDLSEVAGLGKGPAVSEGDEDDAVVGKGRHHVEGGRLLSSAEAGGGDEHTGVLASERTAKPELAGGVPEGLDLCRHVTVTGRDTEEEAGMGRQLSICYPAVERRSDVRVELSELAGLNDRVVRLGGSIHLSQDLLGESLGDPEIAKYTLVGDLYLNDSETGRTGR
jgi:hypothetical protein